MIWLIPYKGTTYKYDDARVNASEARLAKRISGGLAPVELERRRWLLDPDAWLAALAVAMRRAGSDATSDEIDLDELVLTDIVDTSTAAARAALAAAESSDEGPTDEPAATVEPAPEDGVPAAAT